MNKMGSQRNMQKSRMNSQKAQNATSCTKKCMKQSSVSVKNCIKPEKKTLM